MRYTDTGIMKMLRTSFLSLALSCMTLSATLALETTSSGNLQTEASWSALKSMVDNANGRITILQTAITACSQSGKLYAPGAATADAGGCIPMPAGITGVDLSNTTSHGPGFRHGPALSSWTPIAQNLTCPADTVMVGVIIRTSGTCSRECDPDGPIIQSINIKCAPLK